MRLGRLVAAGLAAGLVAGFVGALLRPRPVPKVTTPGVDAGLPATGGDLAAALALSRAHVTEVSPRAARGTVTGAANGSGNGSSDATALGATDGASPSRRLDVDATADAGSPAVAAAARSHGADG